MSNARATLLAAAAATVFYVFMERWRAPITLLAIGDLVGIRVAVPELPMTARCWLPSCPGCAGDGNPSKARQHFDRAAR
jgi:hypothetical protein